jgi:hypothetical protein
MNTKILEGYDNYIFFGAHQMGALAFEQFREEGISVAYFCDNDQSRWDTDYYGVSIIAPHDLHEIVKRDNALVVICSSFSKHLIAIQLEEMGVPYIYFSKPIFVEITSFCNQACTFCPYEYIKRPKSNLDFQIMKDFLYDLKSEKSDVLFPAIYPHVMGEPLVCKHFFDFMDICKKLGLYVCIVTNWVLINEDIQRRLFTEYPDMDLIFSWQGASEKAFAWRKDKSITYEKWIDLMFEIMEAKFKYAHRSLLQISTIYPYVANNVITKSDSDLHIFEWYESAEEFKQWKRDFGSRCVRFNEEMQRKYPENYEAIKDAKSPIVYYYHRYRIINDLDEWVSVDVPSQFEFAPNVHIYEKKFGVWGIEDFFSSLLPEDKLLFWEQNWHTQTEKCDRVGDIALLSSGQLVPCNIDNEADFVLADLNKGEKYTDVKTQKRLRKLRDNLSICALCRRCKARAMVFDTMDIQNATQKVIHYGIRWHKTCENDNGEAYRISYEISNAFLFPRIDANSLDIDIESVQNKKQFTLIKILSYDDETKLFSERKMYSLQLKPGERLLQSIPYTFEKKKLHRIDFITATQRDNGIDNGVAVYDITLRST